MNDFKPPSSDSCCEMDGLECGSSWWLGGSGGSFPRER